MSTFFLSFAVLANCFTQAILIRWIARVDERLLDIEYPLLVIDAETGNVRCADES